MSEDVRKLKIGVTMLVQNKRILLIETDDAGRIPRIEALARAGFEVMVHENCTEAEELKVEEEFDLILVTVSKDPATVFEYSDRLMERCPHLPIVWLTAEGVCVPLNEAVQTNEAGNPQLLMQQVATLLEGTSVEAT